VKSFCQQQQQKKRMIALLAGEWEEKKDCGVTESEHLNEV
jgi:hypothetical protein